MDIAETILSQRAMGVNVTGFGVAITEPLRQRPDVIAIGEVLDHDTVEAILRTAVSPAKSSTSDSRIWSTSSEQMAMVISGGRPKPQFLPGLRSQVPWRNDFMDKASVERLTRRIAHRQKKVVNRLCFRVSLIAFSANHVRGLQNCGVRHEQDVNAARNTLLLALKVQGLSVPRGTSENALAMRCDATHAAGPHGSCHVR